MAAKDHAMAWTTTCRRNTFARESWAERPRVSQSARRLLDERCQQGGTVQQDVVVEVIAGMVK